MYVRFLTHQRPSEHQIPRKTFSDGGFCFMVNAPVWSSQDVQTLPPKQQEVLKTMVAFVENHGYPPSIQQLCQACGVSSTATIHYHLTALKKKGFIHWNESERRAMSLRSDLMPSAKPVVDQIAGFEIPLCGTIAAGSPLQTYDDTTESIQLTQDICAQSCYALRVKGDSMIDDHIMEGDMVLINPDVNRIRQGDVVVALVEGQTATLKRYYLEKNGHVRLQPANALMDPLVLPPDQVILQGKVEALVRRSL